VTYRHALTGMVLVCFSIAAGAQQSEARWKAHDPDRPKPRIIEPGESAPQPPSDAVVLFDGTNLSQWAASDGSAARWVVRDGYMETAPGAGPIVTRRAFGDVQLHIEWATPAVPAGNGQGRGNSGVIFMGMYEVQVLDSYQNVTYADGQAAAVYGQHPPLVNASRPPGAWQSYDVVFRAPRFSGRGTVVAPARMTVFHNGVLVQDDAEVWGPTTWLQHARYAPHADTLPLLLQDHDNPVRYRNVWVRPLPPRPADGRGLAESRPALTVPAARLRRYVGSYGSPRDVVARVTLRGGTLQAELFGNGRPLQLVPQTATRFTFLRTAGTVEFVERAGSPTLLRLSVAEASREAPKLP
jgi:hypothetical protein